GQLDYFVEERRTDLEQWANASKVQEALDAYRGERGQLGFVERGEKKEQPVLWNAEALERCANNDVTPKTFSYRLQSRAQLNRELDHNKDWKGVYDLVLLVAADGHLVTCTSHRPAPVRESLSRPFLEYLFAYDYEQTDWFRHARDRGEFVRVDHHVSPFHLE